MSGRRYKNDPRPERRRGSPRRSRRTTPADRACEALMGADARGVDLREVQRDRPIHGSAAACLRPPIERGDVTSMMIAWSSPRRCDATPRHDLDPGDSRGRACEWPTTST
jgi:hypothetical protein